MHAFHREFELPESHMNQLHLARVAMVTRAPSSVSFLRRARMMSEAHIKIKLRREEGISVSPPQ